MPGLINAHNYPIRPGARFIRLRHTGVSGGSLFLSDLDTAENKRDNEKIPVYIPFEETVDILLTDRTLTSYQQGSIRGFLDDGLLEAWIVQNVEVDEDVGQMLPVYDVQIDDELITVDTSGGDVIVNLPDLFSEPFPQERTPEGTALTIKKISNDANRVIITAAAGQPIEGDLTPYVIEDYLEVVKLQSDEQGNWWSLCCAPPQDIVFPYLSHYNTTDGENDATVSPPSFGQAYVATDDGTYSDAGLDDEQLHAIVRQPFSYVNGEEATQLGEGVVVVEVDYLDAGGATQTVSLSVTLDGTEKTESGDGITVEISGLISDFGRAAGFLTTTIDPLSVPGLGATGGLITRFETRHEVDGSAYAFTSTDPVFVDVGPTPPGQGAPQLSLLSTVSTYLSGVPYATNGTTLRVQQTFVGPFNQTYVAQPFFLDAGGFGVQSFDYDAAEISYPAASPASDEDADLDVTLTLAGSSTCDTQVSAQTRVSDPHNSSGFATGVLNDVLLYNRTPNPTRNSEDFRGEARRLQRDDDPTAPSPRDAGDWDSTASLVTYDDTYGLQVVACDGSCDGLLVYPEADYTGVTPPGPDYTGLGGETYEGIPDVRWYYRHFSNTSGTVEHAGGVLRIELCSGLLSVQDLLDDRLIVEVMLASTTAAPSGGGRSDWLSLNRNFNNATFDPVGATREERGCLTNTSETNQATSPPEFGFTLSSNAFAYFTGPNSNYGVRVRIGMRRDDPFRIRTVRLVGW